MPSIYAIGDLHGRFDLLREALSVVERHAGEDGGTFICMGDFIDRGPHARSIIELLMQGPSLANWRWIVLKGNHESMMLECLRSPAILHWWIGNGGGATLASYGYQHGDALMPLKVPQDHLDWLDALPLMQIEKHHVFVHAGLDPAKPLQEQNPEFVMWHLYDPLGCPDEPGAEHRDTEYPGKHVVHGHQQWASGPILLPGRTDLDTFAWLTGRQAIGVFNPAGGGGPVEILWAEGPPDPRY